MFAYSMFDKKAGVYSAPQFAPNRATILRSVVMTLSERNNLSMFPGDYSVWEVGRFETESGILVSFPKLEFVEEVVNLVPATSTSNKDAKNA